MVVLYITSLCNFRCKICLRENVPPKHLSLELLDKVLPMIKRLGHDFVSFTGGEPCLHPQFRQIVELVVKHGLKFSLVSNGSLLEEYKFLIEDFKSSIKHVTFSLDGTSAEVHDAIRQEGSFEKVKESIRYFLSNGVPTNTLMCINKMNMHQIEDVIKLSAKLGVDVMFTTALQTSSNKDIVLSDMEKARCFVIIKKLEKKYNAHFIISNDLQARHTASFCNKLDRMRGISINPHGEVIFCCDTIRDGAVVGSLENEEFTELYCKVFDTAAYLKKLRVKMLSEGELEPGFNTCEFCNKYLAKFIR